MTKEEKLTDTSYIVLCKPKQAVTFRRTLQHCILSCAQIDKLPRYNTTGYTKKLPRHKPTMYTNCKDTTQQCTQTSCQDTTQQCTQTTKIQHNVHKLPRQPNNVHKQMSRYNPTMYTNKLPKHNPTMFTNCQNTTKQGTETNCQDKTQ